MKELSFPFTLAIFSLNDLLYFLNLTLFIKEQRQATSIIGEFIHSFIYYFISTFFRKL